MTDKCISYGPAPTDSANVAQFAEHWQANYKTQSDRKVSFVAESFRVLSGHRQTAGQ